MEYLIEIKKLLAVRRKRKASRREIRLEKAYIGHRTFRKFFCWSEVEYQGVVIERWDYMPCRVPKTQRFRERSVLNFLEDEFPFHRGVGSFYRVRIPGVDQTCKGDMLYVHGIRKTLTLTEAAAEAKKQARKRYSMWRRLASAIVGQQVETASNIDEPVRNDWRLEERDDGLGLAWTWRAEERLN